MMDEHEQRVVMVIIVVVSIPCIGLPTNHMCHLSHWNLIQCCAKATCQYADPTKKSVLECVDACLYWRNELG